MDNKWEPIRVNETWYVISPDQRVRIELPTVTNEVDARQVAHYLTAINAKVARDG